MMDEHPDKGLHYVPRPRWALQNECWPYGCALWQRPPQTNLKISVHIPTAEGRNEIDQRRMIHEVATKIATFSDCHGTALQHPDDDDTRGVPPPP